MPEAVVPLLHACPLAAQQLLVQSKEKFKFAITQVIGPTNDEVSREFRPHKQMIERLNRTYIRPHIVLQTASIIMTVRITTQPCGWLL